VQMLCQLVAGTAPEAMPVITTSLVGRQSTAAPAASRS
jgi:hypothetical protein